MDYDDFDDYQTGDPRANGAEENDDMQAKLDEAPEQAQPKKPRRAVRKRPKLTLENLQQPNGLQEVFDKFPKWFQEGYKGKGHEVRDLRRLLELYQRWQPRIFSQYSYNQFEAALEKMSGTNALKAQLQSMRTKLPELVDPSRPDAGQEYEDADGQQQDQQQDQQGTNQQQQQQQGQQQGQQQDFLEIDEDELLELQAEPMETYEDVMDEVVFGGRDSMPAQTAAAAAGGSGAAAATTAPAGSNIHTAKRSMRDWPDDDDDIDDIAMPPHHQQQHSQPQQPQKQPRLRRQRREPVGSDILGDSGAEEEVVADAEQGTNTAAATAAAGRGRLRQRHALLSDDSDNAEQSGDEALEDEDLEPVAKAAAAMVDAATCEQPAAAAASLSEQPATQAHPEDELMAHEADEDADADDAHEGSPQPKLQLLVGTAFEGTALYETTVLDDDDDDDDD